MSLYHKSVAKILIGVVMPLLCSALGCQSSAVEKDKRPADSETREERIARLTRAINANPKNAEAYLLRCSAYGDITNAEDSNKAWEDCTTAIELDPRNTVAYSVRCTTNNMLDRQEAALLDCTTAVELNPNNAMAYGWLCNTKLKLARYKEALRDCTKAIQLNPKDSLLYHWRAEAYDKLGFDREARRDQVKGSEVLDEFGIMGAVEGYNDLSSKLSGK